MLMNECVHHWMEINGRDVRHKEPRTSGTTARPASEENREQPMCAHTDIPSNLTVGFLLVLIKIRYRITMSSLMEYAGGFEDLPWE